MIYFELYSFVAQVRERPWCFALCSPFGEPPRSNHRRLADKRACRLGFARLSAPPHAMRAAPLSRQISLSPPKMKNTEYPKRYSVFLAEKERMHLCTQFFLS
jgi:hypothetical protein